MEWFLSDMDTRHERINLITLNISFMDSVQETPWKKYMTCSLIYFESDAQLKIRF